MAQQEQILDEIPYYFKTSGNIIKKLGEESIANKNIAILELIKNAYDANATKVEIRLEDVNNDKARILLIDNGDGMSNADIEGKWMNIATPNKEEKEVTRGERIPVGEKGIGRLSSESLGEQTILTTKPKRETSGYKIIFDWLQYQKKNALVDKIENKGYRIKKNRGDNGTTLQINKLKHNWNDLEVQKSLLKDLYLLHPINRRPKNFSVIPTFKVSSLKKIDTKFLEGAAYKMKVNLSSGNLLKYEINTIKSKPKIGELTLDKKLICGDTSFELYYYYRKASAWEDNLNIHSSRIKETNEILDEYCGVKIYRDGFRVKPYGEDDNDWLELDLEFQNNTMYPRNINAFGYVNISKVSNPKIVDTTTREGIIFTDEFRDLRTFVKTSIKEIFLVYRGEIESHKKKAKKNSKLKKTRKKVTPVTDIPKSEEKLIKDLGQPYPQSFYSILEEEINECYRSNYPNAAFFLSRKLIENLVLNILEKKYPNEINLWYDSTHRQHNKLSLLTSNLFTRRSDFKVHLQSQIEKFNSLVGHFRSEANAKAHNIFEYLTEKAELRKFKINDLIQLLLNIYHSM